MILRCQHQLFDIRADLAYLKCAHSLPLMHQVVSAEPQGVARKAQPWTITRADFFSSGLLHVPASTHY